MKEKIIFYLFQILITIIGYLILTQFNQTQTTLQQLNNDVVAMKMQITALQSSMLTEAKVIEIAESTFLRMSR